MKCDMCQNLVSVTNVGRIDDLTVLCKNCNDYRSGVRAGRILGFIPRLLGMGNAFESDEAKGEWQQGFMDGWSGESRE